MNKYKKVKFNKGDLGVNPFLTGLVVKVNKRIFYDTYKKVAGKEENNVVDVEHDKYCKVFTNPLRRFRINGLSGGGKGLLFWILFQIHSGQDYIWINRVMYMDECNINSENTFLASLKDLIKNGILAKTVVGKDWFWINPDIFFKGDRVKGFSNNIEKMDKDNEEKC